MKKEEKYKIVKKSISTALVVATLMSCTSCVKNVDCDISGGHVHLYVRGDKLLSRYINSEKECVGSLFRTDEYLPSSEELEIISDNDFYIAKDNIDYLMSKINSTFPSRQSYSYGYIYGSYYGFGYDYNPYTRKFEYYYGFHTGWHNGYDWEDISLEEYTSDKVRDITYKFRFYKINGDSTVSYADFDSLDEVSEEYKYFKPSNLVQQYTSNPYYLTNPNVK